MNRYLYSDFHESIISDEIFRAIQQEKLEHTVPPEKDHLMQMFFSLGKMQRHWYSR